jgi:outer membrane protein OmpA-like peptidoglycan-associated protein
MISRVEGSRIQGFSQKEFDEYRLVTGTVSEYNDQKQPWKDLEEALNERNSLQLEGKVWKLTYAIPKNRSTLEIIRSFQTELTKAGFHILYQCKNHECGLRAFTHLLMKRCGLPSLVGDFWDDQRYLAARLASAKGDVYVSILTMTVNHPMVGLDVVALLNVVEVKPMKSSLVSVKAETMATEISTRGSVALYGIYFDTDRAEVKPESRSTLSEIATLLKQNGKLELIVVGHTDNKGTLDYNLDLSLRRAQAVVAALTSDFDVARNRLEARGVGFLSPVAPNTSEENRAKNRRVQLLQR